MKLHVQEYGPSAGRTIVALHGVTSTARGLVRLFDRLTGYHIVAPDLRGHGGSRTDPPWDLSVHLRDIRETLDGLGIAQAPIIGFSFGGRLAIELTAADRSRVERLVLLEPVLQMDPKRAAAMAEGLLNDTSYGSTEEAIDARIASGHAPYAPREHWERWAEQLVSGPDGRLRMPFSRAAAIAIYGELTTPPPPFEALRVPTLLVIGSDSGLVTPKQIEAYRARAGEFLRITTVPGKHQIIGDAADEVAAAVRTLLTG